MPSSRCFFNLGTAAVLALVLAAPHSIEARLFPAGIKGAAQLSALKAESSASSDAVEPLEGAARHLQDFNFNSFFGNPGLSVGTGLSLGTSSDGSVFSFGSGGGSSSSSSTSSSASSGAAASTSMKNPNTPSPEPYFFGKKSPTADQAPTPSVAPLTSDSSGNDQAYPPSPDSSSNQPSDQSSNGGNGPSNGGNGPSNGGNGPSNGGNGPSNGGNGPSNGGNGPSDGSNQSSSG